MPNPDPTETSPLLPKPVSIDIASGHPIDPSGGIVPEGADRYEDVNRTEDPYEAVADDTTPSTADLEQQTSQANTHKSQEHDGMPEVKRRMWIIFPAISIGVFLAAADQTIVVSSYEIGRAHV